MARNLASRRYGPKGERKGLAGTRGPLFIGFNLILPTANLLVADYGAAFGSFMLATGAALVIGKAVLVANATRSIRRYDRAPLIRPILFKAAFYWAVVFVARLFEHWIRFWLVEHHPLGTILPQGASAASASITSPIMRPIISTVAPPSSV